MAAEKIAVETNPTVLALDAAGGACSAALWRNGAVQAQRWEEMARGHAETLMPMVEAVVGDDGYAALDMICVGIGPGGYTGLRIALAAARGLALATGLPVLGIDNFQVHHHQARRAHPDETVVVLLDTRRADFYVQAFASDGQSSGPAAVLPAQDVAARLAAFESPPVIAGDAVARFAESDPAMSGLWAVLAPQHADAAILAELGAARTSQASRTPPSPLYLRPPDVSPPGADRQRLRG